MWQRLSNRAATVNPARLVAGIFLAPFYLLGTFTAVVAGTARWVWAAAVQGWADADNGGQPAAVGALLVGMAITAGVWWLWLG